MSLSQRSTWLSLLLLLAIALPVLAKNGGGGRGRPSGGDPPAPPTFATHPTLEYELSLITYPNQGVYPEGRSPSGYVRDINNSGCAVGWYTLPDADWTIHSWMFDPSSENPNQAIDLSDLLSHDIPAGAELYADAINGHGLVGGGLVFEDGSIVGFIVDMNAEVLQLELVPAESTWDYGYVDKVNNNGDILGTFKRTSDGSFGNFLYNRVSGSMEIVGSNIQPGGINIRTRQSALNLADNGEATIVVGSFDDASNNTLLFVHTKGVGTTVLSNVIPYYPQVNDAGTIFGEALVDIEVQVNRKKKNISREWRLFRETGTLEIFTDATPSFHVADMNNHEVVVGRHTERIDTGTGSLYYSYVLAHFDGLGIIDIGASIRAEDQAIWDEVHGNAEPRINDIGPNGEGQIIGAGPNAIFLLSPALK